jgi:hypothetical protein
MELREKNTPCKMRMLQKMLLYQFLTDRPALKKE